MPPGTATWPARPLSRPVQASLFALGASAIGCQLVLLREVLSTFAGNELAAGLALGIWLFLTGIGSGLGGRIAARLARPRRALACGHVALALLGPAMLIAMRAVPLLAGVRGRMLDLPLALGACVFVFLPFVFASGAMIPLAGRCLAGSPGAAPAARRAYGVDSLGSAAGGLLFSILLVRFLSHGASLVLFGMLNLAAAVILLRGTRRMWAPLIALLPLLAAAPLDPATHAWRFPGQKVLCTRNTPFAQITVTSQGGQTNIFQDAIPLYSTGDLTAEARVHPALCQVPPGAAVLVLGGGVFGTLAEVLKHAPARVDYVELDRAVLDLGPPLPAAKAALRVHVGDGRRFLRDKPDRYDAILVDMPGPQNAQINRYYTEEFFRLARRALRPGGILSFPLPASPNYLGEEQLALERSIQAALRKSFRHVSILPGETHIYLASDRAPDLDIAPILSARHLRTVRLLDYDWPEYSDPFRREELSSLLDPERHPSPPNRDLAPLAFGRMLQLQARKSGASLRWIAILAAGSAFCAALATRGRRSAIAIGSTGFAAMALELCILLISQVVFGQLYQRLSLYVTLFLLGSAAGSFASPHLRGSAHARLVIADGLLVLLALATLALGALAGSPAARAIPETAIELCLGLLILGGSFVTGAQFAAAVGVEAGRGDADPAAAGGKAAAGPMTAAGAGAILGPLYLADLTGAASGAILTSLVLLPRFGLAGVILTVLVLKAVSLNLQAVR